MKIEVGDYVSRKSYQNDTVFKVLSITDDTVYLKGVFVRLYADSDINDLVKEDKVTDEFDPKNDSKEERSEYFYLPGKILHVDGDSDYLERCLKFYKKIGVFALGKKIPEDQIVNQITDLLKEYKPDIVVITGHDAYYQKKGDKTDLKNYKNSKNFVKAIRAARNYEKSQDKLVIIAGACQSNYEEMIKAGANFASSPKRVNIHALDPAIIASSVALTRKGNQIDLVSILEKTKYGSAGMGGIITNGLMYVGFPR